NIVRHATEDDGIVITIEQRKRSTPVAVAWLADRSRIDHVADAGLQPHAKLLDLVCTAILRSKAPAALRGVQREPALQMSMAEKGQANTAAAQHVERVAQGDDVFVFIQRRTVRQQRLLAILACNV